MSLLRPYVPFETLVTFCILPFAEDYPWASYELGGRLMVSYPVPHVRGYTRSPLATLVSSPRYRGEGVRTFLPIECPGNRTPMGDHLVSLTVRSIAKY